MKALSELKQDYIEQQAAHEQAKLERNKKENEVLKLKQELADLKAVIPDLELKIRVAKNGQTMSHAEFTALKKGLDDQSARLKDLVESMPFHEMGKKEAIDEVRYSNRSVIDTRSKISNIIAENSINEVLDTHSAALKTLAEAFLLHDNFSKLRVQEIYQQIGEKLCEKVFEIDGVPSIETANKSLDDFIQKAA